MGILLKRATYRAFASSQQFILSGAGYYSLFFFSILFLVMISSDVSMGSSQSNTGVTYANVPIPGSSVSWTNAGNAITSNDVYSTPSASLLSSGDYSDYIQVTDFNFSIPSGCVITGIAVNVEQCDGNGKTKDYHTRIVKSGLIGSNDKSSSAAWGTTDAVTTYGGNGDLWGNMWSASEINASDFGFAFAVKRSGGGPQVTLSKIDQIYIVVYYYNPLPVELMYFNASSSDAYTELSWQTFSEHNNEYFTLERSKDGYIYERVERIDGAMNSTQPRNYHFFDLRPYSGLSFYRLSQTDVDGRSETFDPISISRGERNASDLRLEVFPTVFKDYFIVNLEAGYEGNAMAELIGLDGKIIYAGELWCDKGHNAIRIIPDAHLQRGVYLLMLSTEKGGMAVARVICNDE